MKKKRKDNPFSFRGEDYIPVGSPYRVSREGPHGVVITVELITSKKKVCIPYAVYVLNKGGCKFDYDKFSILFRDEDKTNFRYRNLKLVDKDNHPLMPHKQLSIVDMLKGLL